MSASFLQLSTDRLSKRPRPQDQIECLFSHRRCMIVSGHKLQTGKRIVVDDAMDPEAVGRYALQVKVQG